MNQQVKKALQLCGVPEIPLAVGLGQDWIAGQGEKISVRSPIDGHLLVEINGATPAQVTDTIAAAGAAFKSWRSVPAPVRGDLVRKIGIRLRELKEPLATLVSWEAGKIKAEALGEVQEMIDVCEFATGLSRQLYGKTIASERPGHRLTEQWHPLGAVGIISAFNFPVAVWAWNAMIGLVCGDTLVWKPSEKSPLTALACHAITQQVLTKESPDFPATLCNLVIGTAEAGQTLAASPKLPLISATGSTRMGRSVAQSVAGRLGRSLLELGGNNGMIVTPSADLDLAVRSIIFSAVGTCGQRCTSLRRLFLHETIAEKLLTQLKTIYATLPIGDPTVSETLVGPLIDRQAVETMAAALASATAQGGKVWGGGVVSQGVPAGGHYVRPAIVEISADAEIVQQETFAPILYVLRYRDYDTVLEQHNNVPQGLSSAIITQDMQEAERFCSPVGSDCGIANVNIGTSGAEIGGAFGGEKETGGGRESGSDSWRQYMRRTTNTINYSDDLPLAQGIQFM